MSSCPSFRQRLFLGLAPLFLFVGLAAMAQQPADDKSKTEIPRAGVNGVGMPRCEYCPDPEYSKEAKKKQYEGVVVLFVVVTSEGKATNIAVAKSPGLGLDEKAIEAVRKWRFKPAMKDGKPVPTRVPIEITFRQAN
jgi:TonB family protein